MADGVTTGMREKLAHHQTRSINALADILRTAQRLGVVREDFEAEATAAVVLSLVFGRVLSDIAEEPISDERWIPTIMKFLESALI